MCLKFFNFSSRVLPLFFYETALGLLSSVFYTPFIKNQRLIFGIPELFCFESSTGFVVIFFFGSSGFVVHKITLNSDL